jgi:hypothetical protein
METSIDRSVEVIHTEKLIEYAKNLDYLRMERDMVNLEDRKRNKRKTPKAGCYPLGYSEYTMQGVPCTLALNELRIDLSKCSAPPASSSIYFDEVCPMECNSTAVPLVTKRTKPQYAGERLSRRKTSHEEHLRPRSAAEEKRQLEAVLKQSIIECTKAARSNDDTQAQAIQPAPMNPHVSISDAFSAHQRSMFAAQILCGLD